ncbi:hypothetical protein COB18_02250 [Candidatus Kaiserbacteria bacterium]|nr:MAG: hypothetical protein COB18_02250 [Candidatus Kaiserbacteria bacterium]
MSNKTNNEIKKVRENIIDAIKNSNVTMRSRYYFVARSALWIFGITITAGIVIYLISFMTFIFRGSGLSLLPHLGPQGFIALFISLPWLLVLGIFIIFILLQILSTHFSFVYKRPLVHTILGSVFVFVILGILIGQTTLHDRAYRLSQNNKLPFAGSIYRESLRDRGSMHMGTITHLNATSSFTLTDRKGTELHIQVDFDTRLPRRTLSNGMNVMVMGKVDKDTIKAVGIQSFDPERAGFSRELIPSTLHIR